MKIDSEVVTEVAQGNPWPIIGVGAITLGLITWAIIASAKSWHWDNHDDHDRY